MNQKKLNFDDGIFTSKFLKPMRHKLKESLPAEILELLCTLNMMAENTLE